MNIQSLETFLQVARTLNITKTANTMGYAQSTVSTHIQSLENELQVRLFDRVSKNITLTQYGENLIPYAQQVVNSIKHLENFAEETSMLKGTIIVGFVQSIVDACFEEIIKNYLNKFPNIKVDVVVGATDAIRKMIDRNEIDIAVLIDNLVLNNKNVNFYSKKVKVNLIVDSKNILATKKTVSIKELENEKFILMEYLSPYNIMLRNILAENEMEIEPDLLLQSSSMAVKLLLNSRYISFLPTYSYKDLMEKGEITILNVPEVNEYQYMQIVYSKSKFITPQIQGFIDEAAKAMDKC